MSYILISAKLGNFHQSVRSTWRKAACCAEDCYYVFFSSGFNLTLNFWYIRPQLISFERIWDDYQLKSGSSDTLYAGLLIYPAVIDDILLTCQSSFAAC